MILNMTCQHFFFLVKTIDGGFEKHLHRQTRGSVILDGGWSCAEPQLVTWPHAPLKTFSAGSAFPR